MTSNINTCDFFAQESSTYIHELVLPVVACFNDVDSRVQYYACEALYNIVKVARGSVLPFFNDIFDGLSKVSCLQLYSFTCCLPVRNGEHRFSALRLCSVFSIFSRYPRGVLGVSNRLSEGASGPVQKAVRRSETGC